MRQSEGQPQRGFKDFLKGRQNRLTPAIAGMPGEIIRKSPSLPDPKKEHISQITKTKPQTDAPFTPDKAEEIRRKHEREQRRKGKKLAVAAKITGAVTGAGLAVAGVGYAAVPAVHQQVDQFVAKHWSGIGVSAQTGEIDTSFEKPAIEVPPIFDNTLKEGAIGENNIARITQKEVNRQHPTAFEKLNDGKNTLQLALPLDTSTSVNPSAPLTFVKSFSGANKAERDAYQGKGIYDTFEAQNVPAGTIIRSPVDGYLVLVIDENNPPDSTWGNATTGLIDFEAPNGNQYRIAISGSTTKDLQNGISGNTQTGYIFKSLINAPTFKAENNHQVRGSYGIEIKKGDPILQVIQPPNNDTIGSVGFSIFAAREGEVEKPVDMSKPSIPTDVELFTTPEGKVILPE